MCKVLLGTAVAARRRKMLRENANGWMIPLIHEELIIGGPKGWSIPQASVELTTDMEPRGGQRATVWSLSRRAVRAESRGRVDRKERLYRQVRGGRDLFQSRDMSHQTI